MTNFEKKNPLIHACKDVQKHHIIMHKAYQVRKALQVSKTEHSEPT